MRLFYFFSFLALVACPFRVNSARNLRPFSVPAFRLKISLSWEFVVRRGLKRRKPLFSPIVWQKYEYSKGRFLPSQSKGDFQG